MIRRRESVRDGARDVPLLVEEFSSAADLLSTLESRPAWPSLSRFDYMHGAVPLDPEWSGFADASYLRDRLEHGIRDDRLAREARRFADEAKATQQDRLRKVDRRMYGGVACVPAYLSGMPNSMWSVTRRRVPSRILHMCIDAGLGFSNSAGDYRASGEALVKTIAGLEGAGYRVRVTAVVSAHEYMRGEVHMLGLPLKGESEPMDFARILYPLTDVSFFRGVGFAWLATNPAFNPEDGALGNELQCAFTTNADERLSEAYEAAFGGNAEYIPIRDMAKMSRRGMDADRLRGYVESRMLDTDAGAGSVFRRGMGLSREIVKNFPTKSSKIFR